MGHVQPYEWKRKIELQLNHAFYHLYFQISTDYNPDLQRSECLALKDFKPGEQFFIFYGPRTNADFFIHNG